MALSIHKARILLGKQAQNLSDEEISSLVSQLEILVEIFIETYNSAGSKKQLGVIDSNTQLEEDYASKSN